MGVRTITAIAVALGALGVSACRSSGSATIPPPPSSSPRQQIANEAAVPRINTQPTGGEEVGRLLTAYFDYDDSGLRPDARSALRQNAEVLRTRASARVELQGNCDERGTEEYNLALGKRRAESAKSYLVDLGIAAARLTTVSFGEENAAVQGSSEAAWAKNRRVDFVLR